MKISYEDEYARMLILIKDGVPLGCVKSFDTEFKTYKRDVWSVVDSIHGVEEVREVCGTYDRIVCCPERLLMLQPLIDLVEDGDAAVLSKEEMDVLHREAEEVRQ